MADPRKLISKATTAATVDSSEATVHRWRKDPAMEFPVPVNINNKLFWYQDEIAAWIEKRPRISEKPSYLQHRHIDASKEVRWSAMLDIKQKGPDPDWEQGTGPNGLEDELPFHTAEPNQEQALASLEAARRHLDRRVEAMAMIACWRDQLRRRLASANVEDFDALCIEVDRLSVTASV